MADPAIPIPNGRPGAKEQFAQHYYTFGDAAQAFEHAFPESCVGWDRAAIVRAGHRVLRIPDVKRRIKNITYDNMAMHINRREQLVKWCMACMAVNINAYITLHKDNCRYCNGIGHGYQWQEREFMDAMADWSLRNLTAKKPAPMPDVSGGFGFVVNEPPNPDCPICVGEGAPRDELKATEQLSDVELFMLKSVKRAKDGSFSVELMDKMEVFKILIKLMGFDETKISVTHDIKALNDLIENAPEDPHALAAAYQKMLAAT